MTFRMNPEFKRKLENFSGSRQVPLTELMPPAFMQTNTQFQSIQEMFDKSPVANAKQEDLPRLLKEQEWNDFVSVHTRFLNWMEMVKAAGLENVKQHWKNTFNS